MKKKFLRLFVLFLILACGPGLVLPAWGQQASGPQKMVTIRLQHIAAAMNLIDEWASAAQVGGGGPPTMPLRMMIGDTNWLDPKKPAVAMVSLDSPEPRVYAIIPFVAPSQAFARLTQAQAGPGYYMVTYPQGMQIPGNILNSLVSASAAPLGDDAISVELPIASLIETTKPLIAGGMAKLQQIQPQGPGQPSAQDMEELVQGMQDIFGQMQTLSIGLTLKKDRVGMSFEGAAISGTQLAKTLVKSPQAKTRLADYKPDGQILYRCQPFGFAPLTKMFSGAFDGFYKSMGIDISCMESILDQFTGEYVAAISIKDGRMAIEGMIRVRDSAATQQFLDKSIFCSIKMAEDSTKISRQTGQPAPFPKIIGTPESTVAGLKVSGIKTEISGMPIGPGAPQLMLKDVEMRMVAVEDLILFANSDPKLAKLISVAKNLKPKSVSGPTMSMEFDIMAFMSPVLETMLKGKNLPKPPSSAKMNISMDIDNGKGKMNMFMRPDDIKSMATYFAKLAPAKPPKGAFGQAMGPPAGFDQIEQPEFSFQEPVESPELTPEQLRAMKIAAFIEKGNLAAMYGSQKTAISYYKQALELESDNPSTHFALAVAYGETKAYGQAIEHANISLELFPENSLYLYGRARIHLLAGEYKAAMEGFFTAAEAGNIDAKNYLKRLEDSIEE